MEGSELIEKALSISKQNKTKQNKWYNTFNLWFCNFEKAINKFFEDEVGMSEKFENTLTDNFQIIKPYFSGSYL